jgi:hypothetical protein
MNPIEADTARVDAMSGNILRKGMRRIARPLIAWQVALGRAFDQFLPHWFRVDGLKDSKQRIAPSYLHPLG